MPVRTTCLCLLLVACVLTLPVLVSAQASRRETSLNGVFLNSSFLDVLKVRGIPHFIGPALAGVGAIETILNPPPIAVMPTMASAPGAGMGGPGSPDAGAMAGIAPLEKRPEEDYILWMYEGNDRNVPHPEAGYITYVVFSKAGSVIGVAVVQTDLNKPVGIGTSTGMTFGKRLIEMVEKYDWPEPFARVDTYYFCSYPDRNVTFSLDVATRKIAVIAIGIPMTVVRNKGEGTPGASGAPGMPGMLPGGPIPPH
jgi:hypothetical protein